ncbi:hypothetical protein, partial [Chromobacterium amazonense]|uniref:hypothetical protein n=1 Tax=Chromobacterium amazonense TaxID=1382803 RepID=UPI001CB9490C
LDHLLSREGDRQVLTAYRLFKLRAFSMKTGATLRWKAPRVLDVHVVAFRLDSLGFDQNEVVDATTS